MQDALRKSTTLLRKDRYPGSVRPITLKEGEYAHAVTLLPSRFAPTRRHISHRTFPH
jgi:hypothetical protein